MTDLDTDDIKLADELRMAQNDHTDLRRFSGSASRVPASPVEQNLYYVATDHTHQPRILNPPFYTISYKTLRARH